MPSIGPYPPAADTSALAILKTGTALRSELASAGLSSAVSANPLEDVADTVFGSAGESDSAVAVTQAALSAASGSDDTANAGAEAFSENVLGQSVELVV